MGHKTSKSYLNLQNRLNKSPQGAPASDTLFRILEVLFTEREADLVSKLPIKMFSLEEAANLWKMPKKEAFKVLDGLADKGILTDLADGKSKSYCIAPTMAGFFEFSLMRTDGKFDSKLLAELFHHYINVEDKFLKRIFMLDPTVARTFVHEDTLESKDELSILDYERASKVIDTATCITVGTCYCRHKMEHAGKACKMPQDVCLTFNTCAKSLSKHGIAKKITKKKAHEILKQCIDKGLVQVGDNVENVSFICNCCGCCCEALLGYKRLGHMQKINANYEPKMEGCKGCGICAKKCPVDAIQMVKREAIVDSEKCIGCGVCKRVCKFDAIKMQRREKTKFVPKDCFERFVLSAIHTNTLQNLIFDNYNLWTYDLLRRLFGIILKLKPVKRLLVQDQLQSTYLRGLTKLYGKFNKQAAEIAKKDYSHPEMK